MKVLVTGSSGLIGSEAVEFYDAQGAAVVGIDNNMRRQFFGEKGDTTWNLQRLRDNTKRFSHESIDIRDRDSLTSLFKRNRFDLIIHCAAQPSHDKAKEIPLLDFEVNAMGTLNLLEVFRLHAPDGVFIFMSTNKVYGDAPNEIPLKEEQTRFDYARPEDFHGIDETCRIDRSMHSIFGASKLAADVMTQEYGRYFGLNTGVFRGGCLTGSHHTGVQLHGFLNYLVKATMSSLPYTIFGYKGKQVRDNIHAFDVIQAMDAFRRSPQPGEVYNLGGGRENSCSMLEAIALIEEISERQLAWSYAEDNRAGDHICYISDLSKLRNAYPDWKLTRTLRSTIEEMVAAERNRRY